MGLDISDVRRRVKHDVVKRECFSAVWSMAESSKLNGVTKARWIAETESNDRHELRVTNCAATTSWRGSAIAGIAPRKTAGVCTEAAARSRCAVLGVLGKHHGCDSRLLSKITAREPLSYALRERMFFFFLFFPPSPLPLSPHWSTGRHLAFPLVSLPSR